MPNATTPTRPPASGKLTEQAALAAPTAAPSLKSIASRLARPEPAALKAGSDGAEVVPSRIAAEQHRDAHLRVDWAEVGIGSLVLAEDDEGGYWPAKVAATKADDHLVLRWHGYPDLPEFSRVRWALALLHPEAVARVLTP